MNRTAQLVVTAHLALAGMALGQAAAPKASTTPGKKPATAATASGPKLPPNVPPIHGIVKTAFSLRYEDSKIGTGKPAEAGKLYSVHYTGWLASNGTKFDSSFDHKRPVIGDDGKPAKNEDGTPKMSAGEPIQFPQGRRGVIPGWDQGFGGMKVGGKRRLFIPYQLAYGELGRPPVIPPKSDLIFDIELVDVTDAQAAAPMGRAMPTRPGGSPGSGPGQGSAPGSAAPPTGQPATQPTTPPPANPAKPTDPTQPTTAPNSAPPQVTPPPAKTSPTAPPDKPANPEQPPA